MTECERFVKEGLFTPDYFKEEVRNGFKVDNTRKKLWAVSIDLLREFGRVCDKHNLKWYCFFGTMLGCVRHHGFIPWDDDVDCCMMREDYDRLMELADEFSHPYFLQTPYTDPTSVMTTIRLRNSETSYIDGPFKYQGFNQGISLGISVVDYVPKDQEYAISLYKEMYDLIMENGTYMRLTNPHLSERDKERVKNYKGLDPLKTYEKINELARSVPPSDKVWQGVSQHYGLEASTFWVEDFRDSINMEFEGFEFPVPIGYDRLLKTIYGDYMEFPPIEKRGVWHSNANYDPDVPYKVALEKLL